MIVDESRVCELLEYLTNYPITAVGFSLNLNLLSQQISQLVTLRGRLMQQEELGDIH